MKSKLFLLTALVGLAFISAPNATTPSSQELEAFEATNTYRASKKRTELVFDTVLCQIARDHSQKMADGKVPFGHDGFKKRSQLIRLTLKSNAQAENVFMSEENASGQEAVDSWIDSKEHRSNMLNKVYTRVGIGYAEGKEGTFYTQIFCD